MMQSLLDGSPVATEDENAGRADDVVRHPFYFESGGDTLFAWLHCHGTAAHFRHAVVICPPLGYELLHSHRAVRHLADALARRHIPTVRFDWSGQGDSSGNDDDPDRLGQWLNNVRDVVEQTRAKLGVTQISVVGIRLGALLAATALDDHECDNLVLWAPVLKGSDFVREMRAIDRTSDAPRELHPSANGTIESAGFFLTAETATAIKTLHLDQARPCVDRVLLALRDDGNADHAGVSWIDTGHTVVDLVRLSGYLEMMAEPHRNRIPTEAIEKIGGWLRQQIAPRSVCDLVLPTLAVPSAVPVLTHRETPRYGDHLPAREYRERPCWIHQSPDVFGIVTEPVIGKDDFPTIVLLNSGAAHRVGPGRLNVLLARQFATAGFRSIRIDLHGLGDSVTSMRDRENDPYPATAFRDIAWTFDFLRSEFGHRPQLVMGLCSGAYAAFQAAAQLDAPEFIESVLINPLAFFWRDGMTIDDDTTAREIFQQTDCFQSAWKLEKWLKLLSGRSKMGLKGAIQVVGKKLTTLMTSRRETACHRATATRSGPPGHPQECDLPGDLRRIAEAERKLTMVFATGDPGLTILMREARQTALRQQRAGQLQLRTIDRADHTFSREFARQALVREIVGYLHERFSPATH